MSLCLVGCQVDIPRDQIACGPAGECPADAVCRDGLCVSPSDAGSMSDVAPVDGPLPLDAGTDSGGWDAAVIPGAVVTTLAGDEDDQVAALARHGDLLFVAGQSSSSMLEIADCDPVPSPLGSASTVFVAQLRFGTSGFECDWLDRFALLGEVEDLTVVHRRFSSAFEDVRAVVGGHFEGSFSTAEALDSSDGFVLTVDSAVRPSAARRLTGFFHLAGIGQDAIVAVDASGEITCAAGAIGPPPATPRGVPVEPHDENGGVIFCIQLFDDEGSPSHRFSRGAFLPADPVGGVALSGGEYRASWNARLTGFEQPALIEFTWDGTANAPVWEPTVGLTAPGLAGDADVIAFEDGRPTLTAASDGELTFLRPTGEAPEWSFVLKGSERAAIRDVAGFGAEAHVVGLYEGSVTGSVGLPDVADANGFHVIVGDDGALTFHRTGEGGRLAAVEPHAEGVFLGGTFVGDDVRYPAPLVAPNGDEGEGFIVFLPR